MFATFFEGFTAAQLIVMLVGAIYAVFQVFVPGTSPLKWAKEKWNLEDLKMKLFVQGFFMGLSVLAMWFTGELSDIGFTLQSLMTYFGIWYGWSQLAWQGLRAIKNGG